MKPQLIILLMSSIILFLQCGRDSSFDKFPVEKFEKIVAYKMSGEEGEVIENGKISDKVLGSGELLTAKESKELIEIFHHKSTYGEVLYACFEPHVGYVFYTEENEIVAYTSICLKCNWMKNHPDIGKFSFSELGNKRLGEIEKKIFY